MIIGIVESLNARPLTWGIENNNEFQKVYASPAELSELLLAGGLDTALISSVEILRNLNKLDYSRACGVCARNSVRSILFFKNIKNPFPSPPYRVDKGSKTSVALFQLLHKIEYGIVPEIIPSPPETIQEDIQKGIGSHLLFGDNALRVIWDPNIFNAIDLASWFYSITQLHFIFALWAYPKNKKIPDSLFLKSLQYGLENIDAIINLESKKQHIRLNKEEMKNYLTIELQYIPESKNWEGLDFFKKKIIEYGIF